jgi:chromosome segregation ATPase
LEERIVRTTELIKTLRREKEELQAQLAAAFAERDQARQSAGAALEQVERLKAESAQLEALKKELEGLRSERKQVRTRIEKLLGQMDLLGGL